MLARRGPCIAQYVLLVLIAVVAVDALVGEKGFVENLKARERYEALERSLGRLQGDNARLRNDEELLRTDPETIDGIARRELGLMKPGEKLFILKDVPPTDTRRPK